MKYRRLGRTDLRTSVVGIGTWQFSGSWGKEFAQSEVNDMFARAKELGINLIDTAECYGDHVSEAFVGRAIESDRDDSGNRDAKVPHGIGAGVGELQSGVQTGK